MTEIDDIRCWRINYGLDRSPHDLHDYWAAAVVPPGAVLALKSACEKIECLIAERDQLATELAEAAWNARTVARP